jgi:hypothetical protein
MYALGHALELRRFLISTFIEETHLTFQAYSPVLIMGSSFDQFLGLVL